MNAESQNISKILKITKHFVKEAHFNHSLSKYNNAFYNDQLDNLIPKQISKHLSIASLKPNFINRSINNIVFYSPLAKQNKKITLTRTLSLPMLSNCVSPTSTLHSKGSHKNTNNNSTTKQKTEIRKVNFLSYKSIIPRNLSFQLKYNNSSRMINDLLLSVRDDTEHRNLKYEESLIFYDQAQDVRRINDSLNKIIEFYNSYEASFKNLSGYYISKSINANTENEVNLKLSSVVITVTHSINSDQHYKFKIPLFLVPVFLYDPSQTLPRLLLNIILFKNKCTSISCELKEKLLLVITSIYNLFKDTTHHKDKNRKYHEYIYTWITPTDSYQIEVRMPLLTVTFKKTDTTIHKYIDIKFFLYLHENNFMHWTFYVVNYLYSFKNFRTVIDTLSSKMISSYTKYAGKDITISEKRVKMNEPDDIKLIYFLTSEEGDNYLLIVHSMLLEITLTNHFYKINKRDNSSKPSSKKLNRILRNSISNCQRFDFSFKELKPILLASLKTDALDFLSKFITLNPFIKKIGFHYKDLNSFSIHMLDHLLTKQTTDQNNIKLFPNYIAKLIYPMFSIKAIDDDGNLTCVVKGENGEDVQLKEFEMNSNAIQLFLEGGNMIANADLIRKLLFYLEDDYNKNDMLNTDANNKRSFGRRLSTIRRRTKTRSSFNLSNYVYLGA